MMYFYRMPLFLDQSIPKMFTRLLICALALSVCSLEVYCQQVVLNTRGERIVVYPDGSWRYYERADSTLLNKNLVKKDVGNMDEKPRNDFEKSSANPTADSDISSMANRFAERVAQDVSEARRLLTASVEAKFDSEARLNQAQDNRKLIEPDILANLEDEYELRTLKVKRVRDHVKNVEKMNASAREMLALPVQKKPKALSKLVAEYDIYMQGSAHPGDIEIRTVAVPQSPNTRDTKADAKPDNQQISRPAIVVNETVYRRSPTPCHLAPKSANSSGSTVAVEKQPFFTHTDEDLRPYFRQLELVTCLAALTQIENNLYLSLEFQIASPDARRNFGSLEHNSMLRLKTIGGGFINLFNASGDQGKIDPYTGNTIYIGNYPVDRETEKLLSKSELDKLRVVWSTGFEDYDIVNLDFLINQFDCLRSAEVK